MNPNEPAEPLLTPRAEHCGAGETASETPAESQIFDKSELLTPVQGDVSLIQELPDAYKSEYPGLLDKM